MTKQHIERTKEMIAVMQAYVDGKNIEIKHKLGDSWSYTNGGLPNWNWYAVDYRVRQTQDTIDKNHITSEYKFMARNQDGSVYVHTTTPRINGKRWSSMHSARVTSPSYKQGTTDWTESVVEL